MNTHIPLIAKLALCCVMCSFMFAGCNSTDNPQPTTSSQTDSRAAMNAAIKQKDWANAWAVADAVLSEHPRDPELMVTVARVAFETGHQDRAADLMAAANLAEEFSNPQHVQLGMVAMAGSGRLFEMMAMLEEAVKSSLLTVAKSAFNRPMTELFPSEELLSALA